MYDQGYNMHTHTSHTDFSTDLSWEGQSLILWQEWRREGVGKGGLEGGKTVIKCCVEVQHMCTHTHTICVYTATTTLLETYIIDPYLLHTHTNTIIS